MMPRFSPDWVRSFAQPAASSSIAGGQRPVPPLVPPVRRLYGGYAAGSPVDAGGAVPPVPPKPPVDHRHMSPEQRRPLEAAWLTCQLSSSIQEQAKEALRLTLDWRAQYCKPLDAPKTPHDYTRFGLVGEQLVPKGGITVRKLTRAELREMLRALEASQSRTERNWLLALHSIRLGQLCAELAHRGIDALEEIRSGLAYFCADEPEK